MKFKALIFSILIALIGYGAWVAFTDYEVVISAIKLVGFVGIAIIIVLSLINYGLRYVRWHIMIKKVSGSSIPHSKHVLYYLAGFALTTTPGKAGEAIRSVYLKKHDVPYTCSIAVLFVERLFDLLAMLIIAAAALIYFEHFQWLGYLLFILITCLIVFIQSTLIRNMLQHLLTRVVPDSKQHFINHLFNTLDHAKNLLRADIFFLALVLGVIAWGAEAIALSYIVYLLGIEAPHLVVAGIYAAAMLVGAVSFLPGGLGSAEATMGLMLSLIGLSAGEAASATILSRVSTLWFAVLLGVIAMLILTLKPEKRDSKNACSTKLESHT